MILPETRRIPAALLALGSLLFLASTMGCPLGRGSKGYGEACSHNNDCAEAHCSEIGKICTKSCAADAECGASGGNKICRKDGSSGFCDVATPATSATSATPATPAR